MPIEEEEKWRPIPEGFMWTLGVPGAVVEASNLGRVRVAGMVQEPFDKTWRFRGRPVTQPAIQIARGVAPLVCRLVAEAWVENPHKATNVRRKDKDPRNNRADNLYWKLANQTTRRVAPADLNDPTEQWQPVQGAPGYEVSTLGRMRKDGKPLKPLIRRGEPTVFLYTPGGRVLGRRVKDLVAHAFIPRPMGHAILSRVKGSDERSCRVTDLLWVADQSFRMGRRHAPKRAKLDAAKVAEARRRVAAGETQKSVAADFGVTPTAISFAVRGLTWRGV